MVQKQAEKVVKRKVAAALCQDELRRGRSTLCSGHQEGKPIDRNSWKYSVRTPGQGADSEAVPSIQLQRSPEAYNTEGEFAVCRHSVAGPHRS